MRQILYSLYLLVIFLPLFIVITLLTAIITGFGCIIGNDKFFSYYPGAIWSRATLMLALIPVRVEGRENIPDDKCCVITPNHQSAVDIFILYGYLGVPFKWVLRIGLRSIPFVGWACEQAGFIFADNSTPEGVMRVVREAEVALSRHFHIVIFPEGTRSPDGTLRRFKKGAFKIATDTDAPILPVSINGAYEILPKDSHLPHFHPLRMVIHPPLCTQDYSRDIRGLVQLSADARECILSGLDSVYHG